MGSSNLGKELKRWLKRKVSISLATIVVFAMTGRVVFAKNEVAAGGLSPNGHIVEGTATAGDYATAVGDESIATGTQATAIGRKAKATGTQSVAVGGDTDASGRSSIAIGGDDLDDVARYNKDAVAKLKKLSGVLIKAGEYNDTTASGDATVAVGTRAMASGDLSTAFGTLAKASGNSTTALGVGSTADKDGSVAIGAGSKTDKKAVYVPKATIQSLDENGNPTGKTLSYGGQIGSQKAFAGGTNIDASTGGDQVSVGSVGFERQIKNVAAGEISPTSTDAINGSQLAGVSGKMQGKIDKLEEGAIDTYFHFNDPAMTQKAGNATRNLGGIKDKAGATGAFAVTGGVSAQAEGDHSVA
ncbi:MAG: hypothetical protein KGV57_00245, partial [Fusobacterium sp.]|nr:hypothetical protein [Fusobacterium sp.]